MVHDWSKPKDGFNSMLVNPEVHCGAKDGFLTHLCPEPYMAGAGRLRVYLSLPFGSGPSPGWNDGCAKEALRVAKKPRASLRAVDFANDLRLAEKSGDRTQLFVGMARLAELLSRLGGRFHTKPSNRWRLSRVIPSLGFEVHAEKMRVQLTSEKKEKGRSLRGRRAPVATGDQVSAKEVS